MIYTPLTRKAMNLAYDAHHGQYDKVGAPYILHPVHLAEQMDDELSTVCALLHDVVEDTDYTMEDLSKLFPPEVIEVLTLLTHDKDEPYLDYLARLKGHPVAEKIKRADIAHNSDMSRGDGVFTPAAIEHFTRKYEEAIRFLDE